MPQYDVTIVQKFMVIRMIKVQVEAKTSDDAEELVEEQEAPAMEDEGWQDDWELVEESYDVKLAGGER
jgi:hypothetical protein